MSEKAEPPAAVPGEASPGQGGGGGEELLIVPADAADAEAAAEITREAFRGVSIDQAIEQLIGPTAGMSWQEIKADEVRREIAQSPRDCFVAKVGPAAGRDPQPGGGQAPPRAGHRPKAAPPGIGALPPGRHEAGQDRDPPDQSHRPAPRPGRRIPGSGPADPLRDGAGMTGPSLDHRWLVSLWNSSLAGPLRSSSRTNESPQQS
jgi:hypothetical protein